MRTRSTVAALLLSMAPAAAQTTYDAKILEYKGLDHVCSGTVTPLLKILNVGTASMNGCVVETWKNGFLAVSFNWILAVPLPSGEFRKPALPAITGVLPTDQLEFRIISVNGIPDEDPEGNIFMKVLDGVPVMSPQQTVSVHISTGAEPGSIKWEIFNSLDVLVASGGPYELADMDITENALLAMDGCYSFKAHDLTRGGSSTARVEVTSNTNTLIAVDGPSLSAGYSKGLRTGNNAGCTVTVSISLRTDAAPLETTWEMLEQASGAVVCAGSGNYGAAASITESCCLPIGCYRVRVLDAGGDGITAGGYVLREQASNARIVDNANNFTTGMISAISGSEGFCLPLGADALIASNCDKLDWSNYKYLVAHENSAVSAMWVPNGANNIQSANSGYEFWIFDPNGTYSFRKFRAHNVSDGFSPASATRAAHMKINAWYNSPLAPLIPQMKLLNVRVRGRVNGVNGPYGPACTMKLDPARAACPLNKLLDLPGDARSSCDATRGWGRGNFVYARPFSGTPGVPASQLRYQFRFRDPIGNSEVIRTSDTYILPLNWTGPTALQCGVQYVVDVRVSKDGGANWCIDMPSPASPFQAWGDLCTLTIAPCASSSAEERSGLQHEKLQFTVYPNPNQGDRIHFALGAMERASGKGSVSIIDATGRVVFQQVIAFTEGQMNAVVTQAGDLATGTYLMKLTIGDSVGLERLVVQR